MYSTYRRRLCKCATLTLLNSFAAFVIFILQKLIEMMKHIISLFYTYINVNACIVKNINNWYS